MFSAIGDYNPRKGKPTTWFGRYIMHEMRAFIDYETYHTTPYYLDRIRIILWVINEGKMEGKTYTNDDIVKMTGYSRETVTNCMRIYKRNRMQVSIEALKEEGKVSIVENLVADIPNPESIMIKKENINDIKKIMENCLNEKELKVIQLYYGFFNDQKYSYAAIASEMGMRKQEIGTIINKARRKLTYMLENESVER